MRKLEAWEQRDMIGQVKNSPKKEMEPAKIERHSSTPSPDQGSSPLIPALKRGRGRPRKNPAEKALSTLQRVAEDTIVLSDAAFDGGGTAENSPVITKESLQRRVARRLNVLDRYLTDQRLTELLGISGLKEVGIYEGIMMDKALVLHGQPTVIIGSEDRRSMDVILPRLLSEIRRRKLITTVSERKIEFTDNGPVA